MSKKEENKIPMGKIEKYHCNEIHANSSNKTSCREDLVKEFSKKYKPIIIEGDFVSSATCEVVENCSENTDYPIEEIWSTKNTLARLIVPRLQAFKQLEKHGYPIEYGDMDNWNQNIQKMIDAFAILKDNKCLSDEEQKTVTEGLFWFSANFRYLRD